MIYEVSKDGPWIDLDQIYSIDAETTDMGNEVVQIVMASGAQLRWYGNPGLARDLARAWMDHQNAEETGEEPRRRRTLS